MSSSEEYPREEDVIKKVDEKYITIKRARSKPLFKNYCIANIKSTLLQKFMSNKFMNRKC